MDCNAVHELLGNYLDEDLTEPLRSIIDRHLSVCRACADDLSSLRATLAALGDVKRLEPASPWFAERLLQSLARNNDTSLTSVEQPAKDKQLGLW